MFRLSSMLLTPNVQDAWYILCWKTGRLLLFLHGTDKPGEAVLCEGPYTGPYRAHAQSNWRQQVYMMHLFRQVWQGIVFLGKQETIARLLKTIDQEEDETKVSDNMLPDDQPGTADVGRRQPPLALWFAGCATDHFDACLTWLWGGYVLDEWAYWCVPYSRTMYLWLLDIIGIARQGALPPNYMLKENLGPFHCSTFGSFE